MNLTIIARQRPDSQQIVAEHAAPIVDLEERSRPDGGKRNIGDVVRLHVRSWNRGPAQVYADPASRMSHLDGKDVGYQWGDDDDDEPMDLCFTYLGEYEYVAASVDPSTLTVTARYRRIVAEVTA